MLDTPQLLRVKIAFKSVVYGVIQFCRAKMPLVKASGRNRTVRYGKSAQRRIATFAPTKPCAVLFFGGDFGSVVRKPSVSFIIRIFTMLSISFARRRKKSRYIFGGAESDQPEQQPQCADARKRHNRTVSRQISEADDPKQVEAEQRVYGRAQS